MATEDTRSKLLDAAQSLVQERGFNAFSYRDLAEAVGIRTASIHYHFKTKGELGKSLIDRYRTRLEEALAVIDGKNTSSIAKLKAFIGIYKQTESKGAICLCGSMASDWETLDAEVRSAVAAYLAFSENWVAKQLRAGVQSGEYPLTTKPADAAASLIACLQGGLILSRTRSGGGVVSRIQANFLGALEAK
ncbi:MAG: TetR/AcrR family transcriptional regulator [Planctomycetes bacterium]|nr:TetR/AcrR family transcriptional regulator [Planctomycetota bacterium]